MSDNPPAKGRPTREERRRLKDAQAVALTQRQQTERMFAALKSSLAGEGQPQPEDR